MMLRMLGCASEETPLPASTLFLLTAALVRGGIQTLRRQCAASGRGSADGSDAMFGAVVALVGGFHVPDVGFERVAAAPNAHFREVANGVLSFGEA